MADAVGNVLRPPSTSQKGPTTADEILGSYARFTQKGLTILSGAGFLKAGTVLKVSATAGKYTAANKADTAPIGILRKDVDAATSDMLANYVVSGIIKGSKVKYADDQDGLTAAELTTLANQLGGRYDAAMDYLIF